MIEWQQIRVAVAKLLSTMMQSHSRSASKLAHQLELPVSSISDWLLCKSDMNDVAKSKLLTVYPEVEPTLLAALNSGSSNWQSSTSKPSAKPALISTSVQL